MRSLSWEIWELGWGRRCQDRWDGIFLQYLRTNGSLEGARYNASDGKSRKEKDVQVY